MAPRRLTQAIALGIVATAAYVLTTLLWHLTPISNVSIAQPVVPALTTQFVACLGTIGVPVFLWARYRLVGPLACAGLVLAFWHLAVPLAGYGDMAPIFFVGTYAPIYVGAYVIVGGVEKLLRRRGSSDPAGS